MSRRWRAIGRLSHEASVRLGPAMVRGGKVQAWLLDKSGGRVGGKFFGARVFVLEVIGRRSGELRRIPLLYVKDGERWAVLAANGGNPRPPAWWLNLRAAGRGHAVFGRERVAVTAREAGPDEHGPLFDRLVANYPPVADYATFTDRRIPVVVLERA